MRTFRPNLKGTCARCGVDQELTIDHILPKRVRRGLGITNRPAEKQVLCARCHDEKTAYEQVLFRTYRDIEQIQRLLLLQWDCRVKTEV